MLQHTSEISVTPVIAQASASQQSKASASPISEKEMAMGPLSAGKQPHSQAEDDSGASLDFAALLKASTEEVLTPQTKQTKQSVEKAVAQSSDGISDLAEPVAEAELTESQTDQPVTQAESLAVTMPVKTQTDAIKQSDEKENISDQLNQEDSDQNLKTADLASNTPVAAMVQAEPLKGAASKMQVTHAEGKASKAQTVSNEASQRAEEKLADEKILDAQAVETVNQSIQVAGQTAGHTPQNSAAVVLANKMSAVQNKFNTPNSHVTQSHAHHEEVEAETLDASLLVKDQKTGITNPVSGQLMNGVQPGQSQPLPVGMTADSIKSQAFMEQFRQQQTVLKQQKSLQLAQAREEVSTDLGAQSVKMDAANNLTATLDKMSPLPMSYQSIPHSIHSQKWGEALGKHLVMAANRDLQKMQITLNPEKLGPIQVRLHLDKDKQLHINLQAHHALTREAMMEAMPRLREMLESHGAQLAHLDVADHGFEQGAFADDNTGHSGKSGHNLGAEAADDGLQVIPNTQLTALSDSMVDYYA